MANGCTSKGIVEEMGQHGMLGIFGAAGLSVAAVETAINRISGNLGERPYGFNLLHSPNEPKLEAAVVDLYLQKQVRLISASAYLGLTLPVVRYRVHGIHRDASGKIVTANRILAKVSRVEVAMQFFSPPPERFLRELVAGGDITEEQARLAEQVPMAQDVTAEADSGGHTDNRPALTLFPTILALRDRLQGQYNYRQKLRVGAAGGIATPLSAAAAFAMGAAYIVTGSVNQACIESGTSDIVRQMLAETRQADVIMAPAADMFGMGVKVQVLKRGTMFAMRATKLYDVYQSYQSLEDIPLDIVADLEKKYFRAPLQTIWQQTYEYFQTRDVSQLERANRDPKYKMALVFRWYLGQSSRWAISGDPSRKIDYQVWCGPSMGAFNEWVKDSFLEDPHQREVVTVALNILYGAGVVSRINLLRAQGVHLPPESMTLTPLSRDEILQRV
jgi:PfaD family protein